MSGLDREPAAVDTPIPPSEASPDAPEDAPNDALKGDTRCGLIAIVGYVLAAVSLGVLALTFGAAVAGFRMLLTWMGAA